MSNLLQNKRKIDELSDEDDMPAEISFKAGKEMAAQSKPVAKKAKKAPKPRKAKAEKQPAGELSDDVFALLEAGEQETKEAAKETKAEAAKATATPAPAKTSAKEVNLDSSSAKRIEHHEASSKPKVIKFTDYHMTVVVSPVTGYLGNKLPPVDKYALKFYRNQFKMAGKRSAPLATISLKNNILGPSPSFVVGDRARFAQYCEQMSLDS